MNLSCSLLAAATLCFAQGTEFIFTDSPAPRFGNVTVHDPSIFRVIDNSSNDKFRIIGSFLTAAKTGDLIKWEMDQPGDIYNNTNKFFPRDNPNNSSVQTVQQQIDDILRNRTNKEEGLAFFASDVHRMPNGKFYHYYNMTTEWVHSGIGVGIADNVNGPYITNGLFVRSGGAGNHKAPNGKAWVNGGNSSSPIYHPNCIDPQAFFDKTGQNFYLVYGSWSGGIFIYEMDIATGLPKANSAKNAENDGYGKRLLAGSHANIEAPYILYSPDTDYYYLFTSFGGLGQNDGYNVRIFRSRNPDGPYEDATHPANTNPLTTRNLVDNASSDMYFAKYGVKIFGGYYFQQLTGENSLPPAGTFGRDGFLSTGHNSALYDAETGKYFLVHHTRTVTGGEWHQVRVHELFVNEDGWLVAAPFRYDGGAVRAFVKEQLARDWKIINHGNDVSKTAKQSQNYTFHANGTITGAGTGTWELLPDHKTAHITLGNKLYKGRFLRSWDEYHNVWVYAFTALSGDGISLWGATRGVATDLSDGVPSSSSVISSSSSSVVTEVLIGSGEYIDSLILYDVANAASWSVQNNLRENVAVFGDREHAVSSVPSPLSGAEWIRTSMETRRNTSPATVAKFKMKKAGTVYIVYEDRITAKPAWLADGGFTELTHTMAVTETGGTVRTFTVYAKAFTQGETVTLGINSNDGTSLSMMYLVAVKEGTNSIVRPQHLVPQQSVPHYYSLKGEPLGTAKPKKSGIYIIKQGSSVRKVIIRR